MWATPLPCEMEAPGFGCVCGSLKGDLWWQKDLHKVTEGQSEVGFPVSSPQHHVAAPSASLTSCLPTFCAWTWLIECGQWPPSRALPHPFLCITGAQCVSEDNTFYYNNSPSWASLSLQFSFKSSFYGPWALSPWTSEISSLRLSFPACKMGKSKQQKRGLITVLMK